MLACGSGTAADTGWWVTAARCEHARLTGDDFAVGAVDIYKCHDQVVRLLAAFLALSAGFPPGILRAYMQFHAQVRVHNVLCGALGEAYNKGRGIPQGCPFSSTLCALVLRPVMLLASSASAIPRSLADDLQ
eukprot:2330348-Alexandrium_andersonii.AAC.1